MDIDDNIVVGSSSTGAMEDGNGTGQTSAPLATIEGMSQGLAKPSTIREEPREATTTPFEAPQEPTSYDTAEEFTSLSEVTASPPEKDAIKPSSQSSESTIPPPKVESPIEEPLQVTTKPTSRSGDPLEVTEVTLPPSANLPPALTNPQETTDTAVPSAKRQRRLQPEDFVRAAPVTDDLKQDLHDFGMSKEQVTYMTKQPQRWFDPWKREGCKEWESQRYRLAKERQDAARKKRKEMDAYEPLFLDEDSSELDLTLKHPSSLTKI
jgi:hypothetical protein